MSTERPIKLNGQISQEAAEWFIEFRTGDIDAEGRRAFDAWVRASPEHLRAFIEMALLWRESGAVSADSSVEDLIARVRAESNVVAWADLAPSGYSGAAVDCDARAAVADRAAAAPSVSVPPRRSRRVRNFAVAAAILVGLVSATLMSWSYLHGPPSYVTEAGEQRMIRLADGSAVRLDSRSRLRVAFTETERAVELLEGQALFDVAQNPTKPFVVHSDGTLVRAVGTQFDVDRNRGGTVVTVVEGRVAVYSGAKAAAPASSTKYASSDAGPSSEPERAGLHSPAQRIGEDLGDDAPVMLSAGEQLRIVEGQGSARPITANVSSATAWTQGQLILESASLAEAAEEFNRYSPRKLVAQDHGAPPLRLSGVFATDPEFLIHYLRERPDILVRESDTQIDIIRRQTSQ